MKLFKMTKKLRVPIEKIIVNMNFTPILTLFVSNT